MAATALETAPGLRSNGLLIHFRRLWARRETVRYLTVSNLKAGHRDKVLGHLWNVLDPLLFMLVYFFVFGVLFGAAGGGRSVEFMLYILVGFLTFRLIDGTLAQTANCIRGNRGLIHEISFPKAVFPVSVAFSRLYDFIWGLLVLVAILLVSGVWPTIHYVWVVPLVVVTLLFTIGAGFIVAYLGAFFADTTNVVNVTMRLLFYCSPVFYFARDKGPYKAMGPLKDETIRSLYMLNPIACFIECYRDALLWGEAPAPGLFWYATAVSVVVCLVGFAIFNHGEGKFAKYV